MVGEFVGEGDAGFVPAALGFEEMDTFRGGVPTDQGGLAVVPGYEHGGDGGRGALGGVGQDAVRGGGLDDEGIR